MLITGSIPALSESRDLVLNSETHSTGLGPYIDILEDTQGKFTLEDIQTSQEDHFKINLDNVPNFGFTTSHYWIRFNLRSELDRSSEWLLELDYSPIDDITIYDKDENGYSSRSSGEFYPFKQRDLQYHNVVFTIQLEPGETKTVYLKAFTTGSMQLPLTLWQPKAFTEKVNKENYLYGIYCGIMLVVFFYNLFLYVSVKDISYLHYVLYVLMFTCMQLVLFGFAYEYLWPNSSWLANHSLTFTLAGSIMFISLFSTSFLHTEQYAPSHHKVFIWIYYLGAVLMVLSLFIPYRVSIIIAAALALVLTPLPLLTGAACWRAGYLPARFYLFAWLFLMFGCLAFILKSFGVLPSNLLTTYGAQIGSALEVILLSFALGDRINYERIEKYKAKSEAVNNLQKADKLKDEFLATISHELRTPLNGVACALNLIEDAHKSGKDINRSLSDAEQSTFAMQSLIEDLLCFTEAKNETLCLHQDRFTLKEMLNLPLTNYRSLCEDKGVSFCTNFDESININLEADKAKITKIITHLMDNAVKFTSAGTVSVTIKSLLNGRQGNDQQAILISVRNTGKEIPKEKKKHIYQAFSQIDNSFTRNVGGLGLGLAICLSFVRLMKGAITFGRVNNETRFDVVLFLKTSTQPAPNEKPFQTDKKLNILIVEDNKVNLTLICKMVDKLGHRFMTAEDGKQALECFQDGHFDLILMDCQMPVMDGYQATEEIRNRGSDIPIIAVTANALDRDRQRCQSVGMNDFVAKPIQKGVISSVINKWAG